MGMGIGINTQETDHGDIKGYQEAVACGVWFTSSGTVMPKLLKYQDPDGTIHTLTNIHVRSHARKNYCGIPTLEYECDTTIGTCCYHFFLLYYMERQEWKVLWKNRKDF